MKKIAVVILIGILLSIISGCNGIVPNTPNNNSGEEYDQVNTEISYLKVVPNKVEMSINETKKFEVKAYNSDNKLISIDVSKIKWTCTYECIACGVVCNVSPTHGSTQTTFKAINPKKIGRFEVWVNYDGVNGKWAKADVIVK